MIPIEHTSDLLVELSKPFVLLCGSSVSACRKPLYPSAPEFLQTLLLFAGGTLASGSDADLLASKYARSLVDGYYKNLDLSTKFERFLWLLTRAVGPEPVNQLLYEVYGKPRCYNDNHSAIAFFLESGLCDICITTNFDAGIELAANVPIVVADTPTGKDYRPSSIPAIIKLHGDALKKTCIATSPQLSFARSRQQFQFLEKLLKDRDVLVLGYSGDGDVDILPHLGQSERKLLWGIWKQSPESRFQCVLNDLSVDIGARGPHGGENVLLEVAKAIGWRSQERTVESPNWRNTVMKWVARQDHECLRMFIVDIVGWRTSWPHLHLAVAAVDESPSIERRVDVARGLVQVWAYRMAEAHLKAISGSFLRRPLLLEVKDLLGFVYWCQGDYDAALNSLRDALDALPPRSELRCRDVRWYAADLARHYVEATIELFRKTESEAQRSKIRSRPELKSIVARLEESRDDSMYCLNTIAFYEISYWLNKGYDISGLRDFFQECIDMEEREAAANAVQFMAEVKPAEAKKSFKRLSEILRKSQATKLRIKTQARTSGGALGKLAWRVATSRLQMRFVVFAIEMIVRWKMRKWRTHRGFDAEVEVGFFGGSRGNNAAKVGPNQVKAESKEMRTEYNQVRARSN